MEKPKNLMEVIVWLNVATTNLLVIARSPIGQVLLIIMLVVFDAAANSLAISMLFVERIRGFMEAGQMADLTSSAQEASSLYAIRFAIIASVCLGLGIFITALLIEKDGQGKIKKDKKGLAVSHPASNKLAWTSFLMSAVGFVMFVMPDGVPLSVMFTPLMTTKLVFCIILAGFSPYLTSVLSKNLARTYSDTFEEFMVEVIDRTHAHMNDMLQDATNTNQGTGNSVPFTINKTGTDG